MGDLSPSFDRRELACRCGCAYDDIGLDLVDILQSIRDHFGQPVHIVSGCGCARHNKRVGGARRSLHLYGRATDIRVGRVDPSTVLAFALRFLERRRGLGDYPTFAHADVRAGVPARWRG